MTGGWLPKRNEEQKKEYRNAEPEEKEELNRLLGMQQRADCQEKIVITTLLISHLADYLAGVLHTTLRTIKTIDPGFEKGAIALYRDEFGVFSCKIINKKPGRSDGIQYYRVKTDSGLFIDIPAFELMTGWEPDFPDWSEIQRGWLSWTQEVAEPLADDYPDSQWNPNEEWEPDDDYYSELAQEWEQEQAVSSS